MPRDLNRPVRVVLEEAIADVEAFLATTPPQILPPDFNGQVPAISPSSGTAGTTLFTATDPVATGAISYTRQWLLSGTAIGTGVSVTPSTGGLLVRRVIATGATGLTTQVDSEPVTVTAAITPTLTLTGPLTYAADAAAGTLVAYVSGVPSGVTPDIDPDDSRWVYGTRLQDGRWPILTGPVASEAGTFTFTVSAAGASSATASVVVTAAAPTIQSIGLMTDLDSDIDDVVAEALLIDLLDEQSLPLSYISVASRNADAAPAQRVLLDAAGRSSVPVGQMLTPTTANSNSLYVTKVADLATPRRTRTDFPDSATVMRTALAAMPDKSHVIICIGNLTDYAALLASPADAISPLTGVGLVNAKVIGVYAMGGNHPTSTTYEANANGDEPSSNYVAANTPVPLYWAPYAPGNDVLTRITTTGYDLTDPYVTAWKAYSSATRQSWDSIPVLHALLGLNGWFDQYGPGNVVYNGGTAYTADATGKNYYILRNAATSSTTLRNYINARADAFMARYGKKPSTAPSFASGSPSIQTDGTPQVGETLTGLATVTNGSVTGHAWLFNGSVIDGATSATYVPTVQGDFAYRPTVTGTDGSTISATSPTVAVAASGTAPTLAVLETFAGTAGSDVNSRPSDSGQSWSKTSANSGWQLRTSGSGTAYSIASGSFYELGGYTLPENFDLEVDITRLGTGTMGSIFARFGVLDNNNYFAVGYQESGGWRIGRKVDNAYTALATVAVTIASGTTSLLRLEVRGSVANLYANGERVVTDLTLSAFLGNKLGLEGANNVSSGTSGVHLDRFAIKEV